MTQPPELPQSVAADQMWGRLMHVVGKKVPRRLKNVDRARSQMRTMTRKVN